MSEATRRVKKVQEVPHLWEQNSTKIQLSISRPIPHPIPYQGSKRGLAKEILARMPNRFSRLVEPFAGSAAITLAVASRSMTNKFWINDAHKPLAALWQKIIGSPDDLAQKYETLWTEQLGNEREFFRQVRERFNETHAPEYFLYLLARCVKAAIRYNSQGKFNNTPDHRRKGAKPQEMRDRILDAANLLARRTKVSSEDYREVLANCKIGDLVYMDPPYQGVCSVKDHRYAPKIDHQEFYDALDMLNRRKLMFIVSYDGRCGDKQYGEPLPKYLNLVHLELCAGRSTQATLLGRDHVTYESLYLSPALAQRLGAMFASC